MVPDPALYGGVEMRYFLLLLSILVLTACTATPPAEEVVVDDTAQKEADIQAIHRFFEEWDEAAIAGDDDANVLRVTDDIIWMEPNKPAIVGKDALLESFQSSSEDHSWQDMKTIVEEIRILGDWAYVRSSYSAAMVPKDGGDPVPRIGKIVDIFERQPDGSWKMARDIYNSDLPLEDKQ
jgi:uncharacterized protein (TIGR02246 family)